MSDPQSFSPVPAPPPALAADAHKGSAGRVLCVCGCRTMPGAALLVVRAAQRAGAGLVSLACLHESLIGTLAPASPETIYLDVSDHSALAVAQLPPPLRDARRDALVLGPGLGTGVHERALARLFATPDCDPIVIDADALNALAPLAERELRTGACSIWTPHPGEAQRLLGREIGSSLDERSAAARDIARLTGGVCVLKGRATIVTDGEREYVNASGNAGMATAGSGDVLSGIAGAYLAAFAGLDDAAFRAAQSAVYVHGRAGDLAAEELGPRGVIASDLIQYLPAAQREHAEQAQ